MEHPFRLSEKRLSLLVLSVLALIAGYVLFDFLVFKKVYLFPDTGGDSYLQFYPWLVMVSDYLYNQGLPTWSFNIGLGQNIFPADLNNPFRLVLILLGRDHLHLAIGYVELIKFILSGWFFFRVARLAGLQPLAAAMGAVLFANSGYLILGSSWHGHSAVVVFGIFYFFAFEKLFVEKAWVYFPLAVFLILSRSPFYLYFLSALLAVYVIVRFHATKDTDWKFGSLCLVLGVCGGLGVLLSAWFTLSDVHRILASPRLSGGVGLFDNLSTANMFQFASNRELLTVFYRTLSTDLMGTGNHFTGWYNYLEAPNFYAGTISLLLLPQIMVLKPENRPVFLLLVGVIAIVLLFPFFRYALYLFSGNYYKGGLSFAMVFCLTFASAIAYSEILKGKPVHIPGLVLSAALLLALLFFPFASVGVDGVDGIATRIRFLIAAFITVYVALLIAGRWLPAAKYFLLPVIIIEAALFSSITVDDRSPVTLSKFNSIDGYMDGTATAVKRIEHTDTSLFRVEKLYSTIPGGLNEGQVQDYFSTSSYHQFNHPAYIRFFTYMSHLGYPVTEVNTRWVGPVTNRPFLQSLLGVKYVLSEVPRNEEFFSYLTAQDKVEGEPFVYFNDLWLPLAFVYDRHINAENFFRLPPECQDQALLVAYISETAVAEYSEPISECPSIGVRQNSIQQKRENALVISEFSDAHLRGNVTLDKAGVLFFSIPYDTGWRLQVNGQPHELAMVNFGFLAAELQPGKHYVELHYEPPSFQRGIVLSLLSLLIVLIVAVLSKGSCRRLQQRMQGGTDH